MLCFRKSVVAKKFKDKRGKDWRNSIRIFRRQFSSHSAKQLGKPALYLLINFGVSKMVRE